MNEPVSPTYESWRPVVQAAIRVRRSFTKDLMKHIGELDKAVDAMPGSWQDGWIEEPKLIHIGGQ